MVLSIVVLKVNCCVCQNYAGNGTGSSNYKCILSIEKSRVTIYQTGDSQGITASYLFVT